jgi:predicted CXXCH cytochrome family protein
MEMIMKKFIHRLLIGLFFALPIAGLVLFFTQTSADARIPSSQDAQPTPAAFPVVTYDTCVKCHENILNKWTHGPHGQALSDPVFANAWETQGKPGACLVCHATGYDPATGSFKAEGVTCEVCHNPIPANHPVDNIPVDNTPDLCGRCHSDPRFATENWKLSAHYQREMTCTVCHDQHSAGMKTAPGESEPKADASALCENCHKDAMQNFPTSKHAEAGVTCVNCHLGFNISSPSNGQASFDEMHKAPDHNFKASLETCNKCHVNQMHAPGEAVAAAAIMAEVIGGTPTAEPTPVVAPVPQVESQPFPVSPAGFAVMAGLLGLACGMVLAPWLERTYQKYITGGKND